MPDRKYWAEKGGNMVGPLPSHDEAIAAWRRLYPFTSEPHEARAPRNQVITGYGAAGPWFDIKWHNPKMEIE